MEFEIWIKANIYLGHLTLFCHVPDQNKGNEGSGLDNGLSGSVSKISIFKLVSTYPSIF